MLISLNWLKDFVDIKLDPKTLANNLTLKTAEVDGVIDESQNFENMVTGKVLKLDKHPNADKLRIAMVDAGEKKPLQIVCGGTNLKEEMYVAVTKIGAKVRWHGEGDLITLQKTKIRDVESEGMIAAGVEIGIEDKNAGPHEIMDLSASKPKPGTPLAEYFNKDDIVLEFDNKALTHRPDLWGHYGIAREVAAITNAKLKPLNPAPKIPAKGESVDVEIKDYDLCPRYCGLIIENIKVEDSPDWLKKRLKAVGHGTHNNIVDITNYIMAELGQPMHAFDKNYIKKGIIVRRAKKGEKITTLDKKERTLDEHNLVIADHEKSLAIAGVMGGENSEINQNTTEIILESANFNASSIRRTSTKLGLRTEAVQRFEKALDPNLAELAIKRAAELILQICPQAKIAGPITDNQKFDKKPLTVKLDTEKAKSKIGTEISKKEMIEILEKLEFKITDKEKSILTVTIPTFRATKDVGIEDDLIEEIARIYGYENIPRILPTLPTRLPLENTERFQKHKLRELLSYGLGFDEVYNYSFYSKKDFEKCLIQEKGHIQVLNYLSEDQTHMRFSPAPNILKNLAENTKNFSDIKLYEIGRTYKEIGQFFPLEEKFIAGAILKKKKTDEVFYEAKGAVEKIFEKLNLKHIKETRGIEKTPYAHPQKAVTYFGHDGETIGKCFMIHPQVLKNYDLQNYSVALFEINFTELLKEPKAEKKYIKIPRFPSIEIDISVVVDKNTEIKKLEEEIYKADKEIITSVELFDIYEGENIEKGKKSVAFKITLQSENRTLTDEEMAKVQKTIFNNLEKIGGVIRGK